jgi:hypothetical protein
VPGVADELPALRNNVWKGINMDNMDTPPLPHQDTLLMLALTLCDTVNEPPATKREAL